MKKFDNTCTDCINQQFILSLVSIDSVLLKLYDDYILEFEECIPHDFMSELFHYARENSDTETVKKMLFSMENTLTRTEFDCIDNIICVSFLEYIDNSSPLLPILPEKLRAESDKMWGR